MKALEELTREIREKLPRCKAKGCDSIGYLDKRKGRFVLEKGYCRKHYLRVKRYGDENFVKHVRGQQRTKHPLYNLYCGIKRRCYNKNDANYHRYGGRGIVMDNEWLGPNGFTNFVSDMGERPNGYSIERIDNNLNYSSKNCIWVDRKTQNNNKRNIPFYTIGNETKTLSKWCDVYGIKPSTVRNRLYAGWYLVDALTKPTRVLPNLTSKTNPLS